MPGLIGYWKQLPTKDEYIKKHNMSKISCYSCGHEKFSDVGLIQVWDNHRRILCAKCKTTLFRRRGLVFLALVTAASASLFTQRVGLFFRI